MKRSAMVLGAVLGLALADFAIAQVTAPAYEEGMLQGIYPAGGQRGQTIAVELLVAGNAQVSGARDVLIDGPPGVACSGVKAKTPNALEATLVIAPDAPPGRRSIRVLSERHGLTNMVYFHVGRLSETLEAEPNNEPAAAQLVTLPVVANGRVNPQADVDCFAFDLKAGQRLVAVVLAHAIDSHGQYKNYGFVDATLQVVDAQGRVVAEAGDTLGLDPQVELVAPADGRYTARVALEAYDGFPLAIYRLVLGELPLATSLFPPGGQRAASVAVELAGPGVPPGTRQSIAVPAESSMSVQHVLPDLAGAADLELPFVRGDWPEAIEAEPNNQAAAAVQVSLPMTANGRIDAVGDEDWYRVTLAAGQNVLLETTAHRWLRSPIDTLIQVFDAAGKKLAENDDGIALDYISMHDFRSTDSRLTLAVPAAGDYFVRVTDQSGSGGPRAVYRLGVSPAQPDFALWLYPDAVPIWGPGSTAAMVVKINRFDGLGGDIRLALEGLPPGWVGSENVASGPQSATANVYPSLYHFLTLTAPPDAKVCDHIPIKIVGRAVVNGQTVERTAQPLTLYYSSDTGLFRATPIARAVVAARQTPWLRAPLATITAPAKGSFEIPIDVHDTGDLKTIDLTAQLATSGVATALTTPQAIAIAEGKAVLPVTLPDHIQPGVYGITVALRWRSDIRIGMPGPCTPLIRLDVTARP